MVVRALGLVRSYPGPAGQPVRALAGADIEAKAGEFVAVVGSSGSGKSTLLNLLGLLERPDAGEIWFDDRRVSHLARRAQARVRGRAIGYVFQSFLLISGLTALDNVLLAARYIGRDRADARREALALMDRLGVADRRDHYPAQLSGGEQQRVAYCRAVLNGPPLVLADEPTGSLDDTHAGVIMGELKGLVRERGASVILVTHRSDAAAEADRALRLVDGRLEPA
jgi:putative ABC transport system ATP-binding protein